MSSNFYKLESLPNEIILDLPLNINLMLPKQKVIFLKSKRFENSVRMSLVIIVIGILMILLKSFFGENSLSHVKVTALICGCFVLWQLVSNYRAYKKYGYQCLPSKYWANSVEWVSKPILKITSDFIEIFSFENVTDSKVIAFDDIESIDWNAKEFRESIQLSYRIDSTSRSTVKAHDVEDEKSDDQFDEDKFIELVILDYPVKIFTLNDEYQVHRMQVALILNYVFYNREQTVSFNPQAMI